VPIHLPSRSASRWRRGDTALRDAHPEDAHHPSSATQWKRSATSAFLLGAAGGGRGSARPAGVACCHGFERVAADPGATLQGRHVAAAAATSLPWSHAALQAEACGGGGSFPSLESWDEDEALF